MDERAAAAELEGETLVPVLHGAIAYIKEVLAGCLDAEIPVLAGMPPGAGKG